jgi:glutamate-1-semialdehyde 2,1-aminomutase
MPHGGTFNANPLTMAAGLASMQLLTAPAFEHLEKLGDRLRQGMERVLRVSGMPGQVTGRGSCVGFVLDEERFFDHRSLARVTKRSGPLARRLQRLLLARGVHTTSYGAYTISTAMNESIIDETLVAMTDALHVLRSEG